MVVHDEETLEEALLMVRSEGPVRYIDQFTYIIITTLETLEYQCQKALERGDIAVVYPIGAEGEDYTQALARVKKQRALEEKKKIRDWLKEHPEIAKASAEDIPKIVKRILKSEKEKGGVSS